jgi:hypothetical protein
MREISGVVPATQSFLLADEAQFGMLLPVKARMIPFPAQDGHYAGPPVDDAAAIRALEQSHRSDRARFLIFAWPAFWWLEHYVGFTQHLRSKYRCVLENERLVIFDLEQ